MLALVAIFRGDFCLVALQGSDTKPLPMWKKTYKSTARCAGLGVPPRIA